jgi:hypothetical protein
VLFRCGHVLLAVLTAATTNHVDPQAKFRANAYDMPQKPKGAATGSDPGAPSPPIGAQPTSGESSALISAFRAVGDT